MPDVPVSEHRDLCASEARSVDDRGMVELVGADERAGMAEGRENSEIRSEAGRKDDRPLLVLPVCELCFKLVMNRSGSGDEPRRT